VVQNHRIHLIGIDAGGLTPQKARIIAACTDIFCAERFVELVRPLLSGNPDIRLSPISPVSRTLERIKEMGPSATIVLLAGGDPLFFGIGRSLCRNFGSESIQIYPAVSSMQEAFARFRIPWDDATFISVHGRNPDDIIERIHNRNKIFFLTDGKNSPARLASFLLETMGRKNADCYDVHVAENLGGQDERLTSGKPEEIANGNFSELSVMIIVGKGQCRALRFGLQEDEIAHSMGLITKNEVRAATLHALRLPEAGVFWDIGAGSGSISIEAAGMFPNLAIFAVESKMEQLEHIRQNREKYSAYTVRPIFGVAPEILERLPEPDRIFIGGSGGNLVQILEQSAERLRPEGIIVVNGVLEKTCLQAPEVLHRLGFEVFISTLQVNRSTYPEKHPVDFNPISIITGRRNKVIANK
jgi:precorrin-6B C5,15-methyltransferase / cobalt-precorrin-6B C5,C15-methyltransferase